MSSVMYAGIVLYAFLTLGVFGYTFVQKRTFSFLPSAGWLTFMVLPCFCLWHYFQEPYRSLQALGIIIIGGFLLLADTSSYLILKKKSQCLLPDHAKINKATLERLAWVATFILFGICLFHLLTAESIPYLERLLHDDLTYVEARDKFQRDLHVPFYLRYLINFNVYIFGPLALMLHWKQGRYKTAAVIALALLVYSVLSTAKMPFIMMMLVIGILIIPYAYNRYAHLPKVLFGLFVLSLTFVGLFYALEAPKIVKNYAQPSPEVGREDDPRRHQTLGDLIRSPHADAVSKSYSYFYKKSEYLLYRVFLTPIEVSNRWYQYYTYVQKEPEPIQSVLGRLGKSDFTHPSIKVGHWAFYERFPTKYSPNAHAYGSVDADAFAYGGIMGVIAAGFILALMRFLMAAFHSQNEISDVWQLTSIVIFTMTPASASILAIAGPYGMAVFITLTFLLYIRQRILLKKNPR